MNEIDTKDLKKLTDRAAFFVERTINGLAVEMSDLILEILEEASISELTLSCDDIDCAINSIKLAILDLENENDVWYTDIGDEEPSLLRDEDLDFIYAVFHHVVDFVDTWDGAPSEGIKVI
jgi:hypothetical protein